MRVVAVTMKIIQTIANIFDEAELELLHADDRKIGLSQWDDILLCVCVFVCVCVCVCVCVFVFVVVVVVVRTMYAFLLAVFLLWGRYIRSVLFWLLSLLLLSFQKLSKIVKFEKRIETDRIHR